MKNPFRRKTTFEKFVTPVEKAVAPIAGAAPRAVRSGLAAVGTFVGVSLASAIVSRARNRQDSE